jgi:sugar phosphate isomerase/epimerase
MRHIEVGLCWGTLENASLLELIEAAGAHGFSTLSVKPRMVISTLQHELDAAALRRRLDDAGVRVQVIDAIGGDLPGATVGGATGWDPAPAAMCFRAAEEVGAPIVNICHFKFVGEPPGLAEMTDAVGAITRDAASRGLRVVLEFVPDSGIPDLSFAMAIVKGVKLPNCGVLVDPWHLARTGGTVDDLRGLPSGAIGAFQLDDRTAPPAGTPYVPRTGRDLPGEGELPLRDIALAVLDNNPTLTAEVEVFSDELRSLSTDEAARRVRASVDAWLDRWEE